MVRQHNRLVSTDALLAMKLQHIPPDQQRGTQPGLTHLMLWERERDNLYQARHPFIARLFYHFEVPDDGREWRDMETGDIIEDKNGSKKFHKALIMEYCEDGDLEREILRSVSTMELVDWVDHVRRYAAEILLALEFLHGRHITFRDLKPSNVLLKRGADGLRHAKLSDFGFSKKLEAGVDVTDSVLGTLGYEAPEVRRNIYTTQVVPYNTQLADLYSFGVTLLVALWREPSSWCPRILHIPALVDFCADEGIPLAAKDLVEATTADDHERCGTATEALDHPFFRPLECDKLPWRAFPEEARAVGLPRGGTGGGVGGDSAQQE